MTDNRMSLFCLVDGEATSSAFSVKISSSDTVDDVKDLIKAKNSIAFSDIDANELTLWRVSIPITKDNVAPILLDSVADMDKLELSPATRLSRVFPEELPEEIVHIIVKRPPPAHSSPVSDYISQKRPATDELDLPRNKKIRITEGWKQYTASDGKVVDFPLPWINALASDEFVPEPRTAFDHLKNDLRAGDAISIPSLGQIPKDFGLHGQGHKLFVTEQMLGLWEDMRGDKDRTYRRVLSGPMGVGKSYLSYFLAARAYAEGWLVLYISDAGILDTKSEGQSTLEVVMRFLALNKDILTSAELEMLVNDYDGSCNISRSAVWAIFDRLLMSRDRKTLLLVDEHGKLFEPEPYVPVKFKSLNHLSSYSMWGESAKGSRVIFTGTAHAKYETTILEESYRPSGDDFEAALFQQLICATKPIVLNATDLNNRNPSIISLDFVDYDTLKTGRTSLGQGYEKVLCRGYEGYPRFDYMLGATFIQASISTFQVHNTKTAEIKIAFQKGFNNDSSRNQIECYLDDMYGPKHTAVMDSSGKFKVQRNGKVVPGFRIIYIRGSPGNPNHSGLVKTFPDIAHITVEEIKEKLFKNLV
ncbi:hypothetical protein CPB97_010415 [Podila verticillata]|nr:hypothetical protein CPB97_010415 [Podila verticillata]